MEYFGFAYRDIKKGFPLSLFDTKGQAEEAINKERALLSKEKETYLADLKILEGSGLLERHPSLKEAMQRDTNPLCLIEHVEFTIHPIDAGVFAEP